MRRHGGKGARTAHQDGGQGHPLGAHPVGHHAALQAHPQDVPHADPDERRAARGHRAHPYEPAQGKRQLRRALFKAALGRTGGGRQADRRLCPDDGRGPAGRASRRAAAAQARGAHPARRQVRPRPHRDGAAGEDRSGDRPGEGDRAGAPDPRTIPASSARRASARRRSPRESRGGSSRWMYRPSSSRSGLSRST